MQTLPRTWSLFAFTLAGLFSIPILVVMGSFLIPSGEIWAHLRATVLPEYVRNSLSLMLGVGVGALCLGVVPAWLVSTCQFPGRRLFQWALLLPLAMPAYIVAYTYVGMLDFSGPLQSNLRMSFGWGYGDYWFPEIRSLPGAIAVLSLVLYPYVYLLSRAAFLEQSLCALEVSRTLGCGPWTSFARVALPLARPAIVAGVSLALMEALADYGTVQYFGVATFTTGIFRTWFGLGETAAAAQLAGMLLLFIGSVLWLERWSRRRARYYHTTGRYRTLPGHRLSRARAAAVILVCAFPVTFGFIVPATQLGVWAFRSGAQTIDRVFWGLVTNSFLLAAGTALLALFVALLLSYGARLQPRLRAPRQLVGLGYAVPGTVIAIGVIVPFAFFDHAVDAALQNLTGWSSGLILSGTLAALLFAYLVRFLAMSLNAIDAGLARIGEHIDEAGRSLGTDVVHLLGRIHIPMMRGSVLTAVMLVFVEVLKELPATLILRPFNFNTLAVRTYELANEERLMDAAPAALTIVLVGLLPVIVISRSIARSRPGDVVHT